MFLGDKFFFDKCYFKFFFILSVKNGFTVFKKVLLSVMSHVLILLKNVSFLFLTKLTCILREIIHGRLLVCSKILHGSMPLNSCIRGCFKLIKLKLVVLRSHFNNTIFNVKHKRFIRISLQYLFLVLHRVLSLLLMSFYENLTKLF